MFFILFAQMSTQYEFSKSNNIVIDISSGVSSNFGPLQDLKNRPLIPYLALYGLKIGPFWAVFFFHSL